MLDLLLEQSTEVHTLRNTRPIITTICQSCRRPAVRMVNALYSFASAQLTTQLTIAIVEYVIELISSCAVSFYINYRCFVRRVARKHQFFVDIICGLAIIQRAARYSNQETSADV